MAEFAVKLVCRQFYRQWSYTFYRTSSSAADAIDAGEDLWDAMARLHTGSVDLARIEAAPALGQVGVPARTPQPDRTGLDPQVLPTRPDVTPVSALLEFRTEDGLKRRMWLRGVRDDATQRNVNTGASNPGAVWSTHFQDFQTYINLAGWQMQRLAPPTPNTDAAWKSVLQIAPEPDSGGSHTVVTTRAAHALTLGQRVLFKFDRSKPELLGFRNIHLPVAVQAGGSAFTIQNLWRYGSMEESPQGMFVRRVIYSYPVMKEVEFITWATRDTGTVKGPRGARRGRSYRR